VAGFDTQREAFLGPYRGWDRPLAVETGSSTGSIAHGWAPCGSHHVVLALEPGETREVVFVLGYAENPKDAKFDPPSSQTVDTRGVRPLLDRYLQPGEVAAAVERLRGNWRDLLDSLQVTTPSDHVDRMVNVWNAYQCMVTFNLSRSASSFESGIGRGMGFRDSNQDLLGFVHMVPAVVPKWSAPADGRSGQRNPGAGTPHRAGRLAAQHGRHLGKRRDRADPSALVDEPAHRVAPDRASGHRRAAVGG
jgi:cellobiose phosphorylase